MKTYATITQEQSIVEILIQNWIRSTTQVTQKKSLPQILKSSTGNLRELQGQFCKKTKYTSQAGSGRSKLPAFFYAR